MQRRVLTVLGAAIIAMFAGGIWFVARSSEEGDRRTLRYGRRRYRPNPVTLPITPSMMVTPRGSGGGSAPGDARLIANLADRTGPLIVAIQQIYAADRLRTILEPSPTLGGPVGPFQLSLRVSEPDPPKVRRVMIDRSTVSAVDATGRRLGAVEPPAPLASVLQSATGSMYTFFMDAPADSATLLRSVRGRVRPMNEADGPGWDFHLRNVPLPNSPRLYGDVSYAGIRRLSRSAPPNEAVVLIGAALDSYDIRPPDSTMVLPPLRAIMPVGVPTSLAAVTPNGMPPLTITTKTERTGHIVVEGLAGRSAWRTRVWDYEPFVVAMPARKGGERDGVWLRVSRSERQVLLSSAQVAFAAQRGQPGGSIAVRILGPGSHPFGPALVPVDIRRKDNGSWTGATSVLAPVRSSGLALIGNLAPGAYRLTFRMEAAQIAGAGVVVRDVGEYVRRRYGVTRAVWRGGLVQEIEVAPGLRVYGRPIELEGPSSEGTANGAATH